MKQSIKYKIMKPVSPHRMALVASFALTLAAPAASVIGSVSFSTAPGGEIILQDLNGVVTTNLALATGIQSWTLAEVNSGSGTFSTVGGSAVTFAQPWIFNPSTSESPLWTIAGPDNFSFDLVASSIGFQNGNFLVIEGTGTLKGTNFDPTPGTWSFQTQGGPGQSVFNFNSTTTASAVPDGSTTLVLLSGSLLGLCGLRHKLCGRRRNTSNC